MKFLAIDVGIINLGMVGGEVDDFGRQTVINPDEVNICKHIDITKLFGDCLMDGKLVNDDCKLYHEKNLCDYMMHLFAKYSELFNNADIILVERQPLCGIVSIQDLILREYRSKTLLISPNKMLNSFGILCYDYDHRKVLTTKIAEKYLSQFNVFENAERKHDMADAFCIMYFYITQKKNEYIEEQRRTLDNKMFGEACRNIKKFTYIE
jgi:hypothetical protein